MNNFEIKWDTEVKQLAQNCINYEILNIGMKPADQVTTEEKLRLDELIANYRDIHAMIFISQMIFKVEHDLADGREAGYMIAIMQIHNVLSSEDYINDIWKGHEDCDEYRNLMKLRDGLASLKEM